VHIARIAAVILTLSACAGTAESKTRTALDAVALSVEPAYSAAMSACVDRQQAVLEAARADMISPDVALVEFNAISQRCHRTRAAFEVVRLMHNEAADLVEAGKLAEAKQALAELLQAWRALERSP
jgi:hypothetical protein